MTNPSFRVSSDTHDGADAVRGPMDLPTEVRESTHPSDGSAEPTRPAGTADDARKRLREAEDRYRSLVESLPAVVFIDTMDERATNVYTSPQTAELLGYTQEEWAADPDLWFRIIHPDDRELVAAAQQRYVEDGAFDQTYRIVAKDGRVVWVRDIAKAIRDADGDRVWSQGILLDVTAQKQAEQALADALAREREASARLRELDAIRNTLLHAVSHDLRGPLTTIIGALGTALRDDAELPPSTVRELLEQARRRAEKMDETLGNLLDLERLDRGSVEPRRTRVNVGALVAKVTYEADHLGDHPVEVEVDSLEANVDAAMVERIVDNLLTNAARHTPPGTRIWTRVHMYGGSVLIAVEDDGPGVRDELKESVFEPFRRGERSGPGSGLGLSLVARFAEMHGGRAWVEDRPGGGASFLVLLPGS
jgi:PAS domain S-box-containing protein